jgi:hypothetical protein
LCTGALLGFLNGTAARGKQGTTVGTTQLAALPLGVHFVDTAPEDWISCDTGISFDICTAHYLV